MASGNDHAGFIYLHRSLHSHWIAARAEHLAAWIDLLMLANWKDRKQPVTGGVVVVPRGSALASERFLQKRWKRWGFRSRKMVRTFVRQLEQDRMITRTEMGPRDTMLTICNYDSYQRSEADAGPTKGPRGAQREEVKEGKKVEEVLQPPLVGLAADARAVVNGTPGEAESFGRFWSAYPRKVGKANAEKAWTKTTDSRPPLAELLRRLEALKASAQWKRDGGQFVPHPATWLNRGGWEDEPENGRAAERGPRTTTGGRWEYGDPGADFEETPS